jgi:hypothetical protein
MNLLSKMRKEPTTCHLTRNSNFQNEQRKRATELAIANKELCFQNEEKENATEFSHR